MRERLIELLMDSEAFNDADGKADAKHIADYLLANGVIVPPCMDNETIMAIESIKAQASGWQECCRKWQYTALDLEENIEQIFAEIMDFIKSRYTATETLANESDNEDYYAGCSDAYLRVGGFINELKKKYLKGGAE